MELGDQKIFRSGDRQFFFIFHEMASCNILYNKSPCPTKNEPPPQQQRCGTKRDKEIKRDIKRDIKRERWREKERQRDKETKRWRERAKQSQVSQLVINAFETFDLMKKIIKTVDLLIKIVKYYRSF